MTPKYEKKDRMHDWMACLWFYIRRWNPNGKCLESQLQLRENNLLTFHLGLHVIEMAFSIKCWPRQDATAFIVHLTLRLRLWYGIVCANPSYYMNTIFVEIFRLHGRTMSECCGHDHKYWRDSNGRESINIESLWSLDRVVVIREGPYEWPDPSWKKSSQENQFGPSEKKTELLRIEKYGNPWENERWELSIGRRRRRRR